MTDKPNAKVELNPAIDQQGVSASRPKLVIENAVSDDPFALANLRVPQDFLETTTVKKLLTTVPVQRPGPQTFFRIHPSPEYRETFAFLEFKDEREIYLVNLKKVPELESECYLATLYTGITRGGMLFMWPVRVPAADGRRPLAWHTSAAEAAQNAMVRWIKIKSNMELRAYEISPAESANSDPQWPDLTFDAIYRIAFKDGVVNTLDHPAVKRLRG